MFGDLLRAPICRENGPFARVRTHLESAQLQTQAHADDGALLDAMRTDDLSALMTLYDRYSADVFALCIHATKDRPAAEDLLLSVFAELWQRRHRLHSPPGGLRTLLLGMAQLRAHRSE